MKKGNRYIHAYNKKIIVSSAFQECIFEKPFPVPPKKSTRLSNGGNFSKCVRNINLQV
jgi:hypothetical protein